MLLICLLMTLIISISYLMYLCVSRGCACRRLPPLMFFILRLRMLHALLSHTFYQTFVLTFVPLSNIFIPICQRTKIKNPDCSESGFMSEIKFEVKLFLYVHSSPDSHMFLHIRFFTEII
jgi:hypothetical protein